MLRKDVSKEQTEDELSWQRFHRELSASASSLGYSSAKSGFR